MYIFAEPVTEEQADEIQSAGEAAQKEFAKTVVGIGKDDPEVQAAWQNIQDTVDEQVDEDKDGKLTGETPGDEVSKQEEVTETAEEQSDSHSKTSDLAVNETVASDETSTNEPEPSGPLMGWTLTIRNKVNDGYVAQPTKLTPEDEWKIEYHVQEIPEGSRWRLYTAVKERRRGLVGGETEADKSLQNYRNLIQRFSNRGREWREKQDKLNEEMGIQMYKPMGPGSGAVASDGTEKAN
jgi:hypothetical protein